MTVSYTDVREASARIAGHVHITPVMQSEQLNRIAGLSLFFKAEHLQKVGAFKARGAVNAVFSLDKEYLKQGVTTHSSGNHGAALARAGALRGGQARIVVPSDASVVKKAAIAGYGAQIIECEPTLAARQATLDRVVAETKAAFIHPYDDEMIIAGAGTAALEFVDQVRDLDVMVAPIGGGGLLAGTALVSQAQGIKVFGAEPMGADDAARSFRSGKRVLEHVPDTICDGLLTTVGERNWDIVHSIVEDILLVSDEETVAAMYLIWSRMKQIVEPSSAVALAAIIKYKDLFSGLRVGVILSGGNVDLVELPFQSSNKVSNLT